MNHSSNATQSIRVIICCRDSKLRSTLAQHAAIKSLNVTVSERHSLAELQGSTWHAGVLCTVVNDDQEEAILRNLTISKDTEVIVFCPRDRVDAWKLKIKDGSIHSYVVVLPIQDTFDLMIRIRRVIERASLKHELLSIRYKLQKSKERKAETRATRDNRGRILVIEDDIASAELLSDILEPEGYLIKRATSVVNACRDFPLESFQVILVDLMMPGVSGPKVVEVLRKKLTHERTPIIVTSSHSEPHIVQECLELGAQDFLVKPITREKLLHRLESVFK